MLRHPRHAASRSRRSHSPTIDADKRKLDGSHRYALRFPPGQLAPVNAFCSLTLYELPPPVAER
ncbi:MAG TPA: DUF1214 domain-containing protein [Burkholderiaceae bacterium]|nr:DUF1214 domain-containing protein [Burkholderiaceae bacterium]